MELFKLFGTIAIQNADANEQIDDTTDRAKESENQISGAFKKIGTAVATYFAADKIKDFGLNCINAAADANATSSQFSQVFGDMESQAKKSLTGIADNTGIQVNRMKGSYTQIAAFAKTTGMDTSNALGLADRAMVAVADSAAFYDRTLEETTESLQSFLKGNYENDSALGLSCTEVTRNEAANRLYGKSFKDLSEAQKQLTLLQMVEDANKASGALGQAARESDTWTNQTGNLKQAWTNFQAVLGKKVLPIAVNTVKMASEAVGVFTGYVQNGSHYVEIFSQKILGMIRPEFLAYIEEWAYYMKDVLQIFASNTIDMFASKLSGLSTLFVNIGNVLQPITEAVLHGFMEKFDDIAVIWNDVFVPALSLVIDILTSLSNTILVAILPAIQKISEKFQELQQFVSAAIQNYIVPAIQSFIVMLQQLLAENQDKIQLIGDAFRAGFDFMASIVSWFVGMFKSYIYPFFAWLSQIVQDNMDKIKDVFQSVFDIIGGIAKAFIALFKGDWKGLWDAIKEILKSAVDFVKNRFELMKSVISTIINTVKDKISQVFGGIADTIKNKLDSAKDTVSNIFNNIKKGISDKINAAKDAVKSAIDKIKGFFNFSWSLPKIKLPHFNISGKFSLNPPSIPHFSVSWYKKAMDNPVMFTKPTIFSMNPATGQAKGAGEAGDELMIGKETMLNMIRQAVTEQNAALLDKLDLLIALLSEFFPEVLDKLDRPIVLDSGELVNATADKMDAALGKILKKKERGVK